jgi:single-strand DNA-binding protein
MSDVNRIFLTGRLVADPDIRYTPTGNEVAQFRIAVNRNFKLKDSEQWQEDTFFVTIIAWNRLAEKVEKTFKKGNVVFVEGSLRIRDYEVDGVKKWVTEITARSLKMLTGTSKEVEAEEPVDENNEPNVPFS